MLFFKCQNPLPYPLGDFALPRFPGFGIPPDRSRPVLDTEGITMSAPVAPAKKSGFGIFKAVLGGFAGLATGVIGVYATAIVDQVAKPGKPIANFAVVRAEGLNVNFQNQATGQTGWWDFGDGSPLEPFEPEKSVAHAYAKPGHYSVKLTVRNFLMEENDRSVPVDLTVPTVVANPTITDFTVEPIGGAATAPATFRLRGEVKNADRVIWDLGNDKVEVTDSPGVFEKLIVIERPGEFPIQMIGLMGKIPVKKSATVKVLAPSNGALSVLLRVTDTGSKIERREVPETVSLSIPAKDAKAIERTLAARPGYTIAEAKLGKVSTSAVKNLKVVVASDKQSAKLTGEWASTGDAAQKATGGSDVMVPLLLIQEKSTPLAPQTDSLAAAFTGEGGFVMRDTENAARSASLPVPAVPEGLANPTRKMQLEIREMAGDRVAVVGFLEDLKLPLRGTITSKTTGLKYVIDASLQKNGSLRVVLTPVPRV